MNLEDIFFGLLGGFCMLSAVIMLAISPFFPVYRKRRREGTLNPNKSFLENFFSA